MSADWQKASLVNLCVDVSYGYTESAQEAPVGPKFLRITDIQNGVVDWPSVPHCTIDTYKLPNYLLKRGDIVIARTGNSTGENYVFDSAETAVFASYLIRYRIDDAKVNPFFVWYQLRSKKWWDFVAGSKTGSAQAGANAQVLGKFEIAIPSRKIQDRIVDQLKTIDTKIAINRRINQTLEAMAQAIFKSWFVDFDPVKAKIAAIQEGRDPLRAAMSAISGKSESELDALPPQEYEQLAATAALFPDEMEESELGAIPRGWGFKSVGDIAQFSSGKINVSSLSEDIYISTENMLENRGGVTRATSLPSVANVPSFKTGQVLVSNIRPYFKKIWIARFDGGRSPDVLAFESVNPQWTEFLYNLMYQDVFFEFMTRTAKGAKMPRGDKDAIMGWKFPCPDEFLMVAFSEKARPIYAHIESLTLQSKSLATLRDTLLPKLLSGELSVTSIDTEPPP